MHDGGPAPDRPRRRRRCGAPRGVRGPAEAGRGGRRRGRGRGARPRLPPAVGEGDDALRRRDRPELPQRGALRGARGEETGDGPDREGKRPRHRDRGTQLLLQGTDERWENEAGHPHPRGLHAIGQVRREDERDGTGDHVRRVEHPEDARDVDGDTHRRRRGPAGPTVLPGGVVPEWAEDAEGRGPCADGVVAEGGGRERGRADGPIHHLPHLRDGANAQQGERNPEPHPGLRSDEALDDAPVRWGGRPLRGGGAPAAVRIGREGSADPVPGEPPALLHRRHRRG
mmetsp:Transcript_26866/g.65227  ORF Transcript_26866/g.65227 Transcript_26866/m.65227 type:complete len:285 (+) Transcript_26866:1095-1949(+)